MSYSDVSHVAPCPAKLFSFPTFPLLLLHMSQKIKLLKADKLQFQMSFKKILAVNGTDVGLDSGGKDKKILLTQALVLLKTPQ